jgi:23S rRNA pseudouridine2605 synthase
LIQAGRVKINGQVVRELGVQVEVGKDQVMVDDQPVEPFFRFTYILLNKPSGYLSTVKDPFGRKTVMELVPSVPGLVPVGRLDKDTEGLLLLTNDGELTHRLTHPRYEIPKTYRVRLDRSLTPEALSRLREGIDIGEKRPATVDSFEVIHNQEIRVTLHEGRKREVKRIFSELGYRVVYLLRERYAFLDLEGLGTGEWRYLSDVEVEKLKQLVRLSHGN